MSFESCGRQSRLADVGEAGQARIAASTADVVLDGIAATVCARYLAGCGVGTLRVRDAGLAAVAQCVAPEIKVVVVDDLPAHGDESSWDLQDPVAREVARGAGDALRIVRAVLGLGG
jgi:hypothetical protein